MPLYEFECQDCKENFDKLVRLVGAQDVVCPKCGSAKTEKKLSVFATLAKGARSVSESLGSNCAPGGT
ncbi:MAG: zinc ribbon domain-containing protein [Anaerolineae bacterium]|nr:zinc ribbon domain-containing protein [Anaerolineae bacterium]